MILTMERIIETRKRLHCSIRMATNIAKREQMLEKLNETTKSRKMVDFKSLMTEVINELYID